MYGSHCGSFSCCGAQGSRVHGLQQLWCLHLVALWHTGSSWTRDHICVPYIGRWILNHCTTREVPQKYSLCTPCATCQVSILKETAGSPVQLLLTEATVEAMSMLLYHRGQEREVMQTQESRCIPTRRICLVLCVENHSIWFLNLGSGVWSLNPNCVYYLLCVLLLFCRRPFFNLTILL